MRNANVFSVTVLYFVFVLPYFATVSNRSTQFCAVHSLGQFYMVRLYAIKINITINVNVSLPKRKREKYSLFLGYKTVEIAEIEYTYILSYTHTHEKRSIEHYIKFNEQRAIAATTVSMRVFISFSVYIVRYSFTTNTQNIERFMLRMLWKNGGCVFSNPPFTFIHSTNRAPDSIFIHVLCYSPSYHSTMVKWWRVRIFIYYALAFRYPPIFLVLFVITHSLTFSLVQFGRVDGWMEWMWPFLHRWHRPMSVRDKWSLFFTVR